MAIDEMPDTVVNENPRLELLRALAEWRETEPKLAAQFGWEPGKYASVPLGEYEWRNPWDLVVLAARESAAIGHITKVGEMVAITDAGYAWIQAHDALGEATQEGKV